MTSKQLASKSRAAEEGKRNAATERPPGETAAGQAAWPSSTTTSESPMLAALLTLLELRKIENTR